MPLPFDLHLGGGSPARLLAVAALAMILAGLATVAASLLAALGRVPPPCRVSVFFLDRVRIVSDHGRELALALAILIAAVVAGAAWGGPPGIADALRERFAGPLARIGLAGAQPGAGDLATLFFMTLLVSVVLRLVLAIGIPALVPGLGLAAALAQGLVWGMMLAPEALTLLVRVPYRAAVAGIEAVAFGLAALGAWRVVCGLVRPLSVGTRTRREGFAVGADQMYRLLVPAMAVLAVAAAAETALVAIIAYTG
jgi:hypothetical protein